MKTINCVFLFIFIFSFSYSQNTAPDKNSEKINRKNLGVEEYTRLTNNPDKAVLVHFEADWCALCKKLKPILSEIAAERKDKVEVFGINTDDNPKIAKHLEVDGLPIMILYKNGKIVWSMQGVLTKREILGNLDLYQ
jgi:thioredoxin 1